MIETVAGEVDELTIKSAMQLAQTHVGELITQQLGLQRECEKVQKRTRRGEEQELMQAVFDEKGYVSNFNQLTNAERRETKKVHTVPEKVQAFIISNDLITEAMEVYQQGGGSKQV